MKINKLKIGSFVIAKHNFRMIEGNEIALIKNKAYQIIDIDYKFIHINSEVNKDHHFTPKHFYTLKQARKQKLKKINENKIS